MPPFTIPDLTTATCPNLTHDIANTIAYINAIKHQHAPTLTLFRLNRLIRLSETNGCDSELEDHGFYLYGACLCVGMESSNLFQLTHVDADYWRFHLSLDVARGIVDDDTFVSIGAEELRAISTKHMWSLGLDDHEFGLAEIEELLRGMCDTGLISVSEGRVYPFGKAPV